MKRRQFLLNTGMSLPLVMGGFNIGIASPMVNKFASSAQDTNGRVLVLIQLNGGNDGLNTVIPIDFYSNLYKHRQNVLMPENSILKLRDNLGLHPQMTGFRELYENGKLGVIQNVGYPEQNFSHFRSIDIWTSGSASDKVLPSGWVGRYLASQHPDFPSEYPNDNNPDPLSITIGSMVSNTCQGPIYNMGMAVANTDDFYELRPSGFDQTPNTPAGYQLDFIKTVIGQTQVYTESIKKAVGKAENISTLYPDNNSLASQLKIVARLIAGGLKTKIYVCQIGGFDTHASQVEEEGGILGEHATLLKQLSDAVFAFQDDLKKLGLEDRVAGMTFSEFGRRIMSNGSVGTDHGAAAPLFVFGSQVNPIIHGNNPVIPDEVRVQDNLPMEHDFRAVYYSVLRQWLDVPEEEAEKILFNRYDELPIFMGANSIENQEFSSGATIFCYPNPIHTTSTITINSIEGKFDLELIDSQGRVVEKIFHNQAIFGEYTINYSPKNIASGYYSLVLSGTKGKNRIPIIISR